MDFTISNCSFLINEISHSLIIREKGKIADLFFQFENQNTFLKTFKQSETDQFSIFLMSQNKQTILRNTPKILKNADLLSKNIIEVCNNNSGQAHMKLKNSKTGTTIYHYLPFTSIQADTISNSTVELNIVLRDPYNTSDEGIYSATINIINGSIIHMNPIIEKTKLGSPDFDFDFTPEDKELSFDNPIGRLLAFVCKCVNYEAVTCIETRGGCHILVNHELINSNYKNTWYNSLKELGPDNVGDTLVPIPGCYQGGFTPKIIN